MKRRPRSDRQRVLIGIELDTEILPLVETRIKELDISKRQYIEQLVLKDLGLRMVPARYIKIDEE